MPSLLDDLLSKASGSAGLEPLVGALHSNRGDREPAQARTENYRNGKCRCVNYPDLLSYAPRDEEHSGHVWILSTSEPDWSMTYHCECAACGQQFDVEQGDYHYTWWKWVPRGVKRRNEK